MIKPGKPRVFEQGTCPGMDENNHPEGKYVRVGKGGSIESLEWRDNVYTVTLKCPNLKWKGQGIGY